MSDSPLAAVWLPAYSGNYTPHRARYASVQKITLHHMAGRLSVEALGALWQTPARKGSSHYGVCEGRVGQYVREADIAWCDGSWSSNVRSVSIEVANSGSAPHWPVADEDLAATIRLVADIARRNGLHPLVCGQSLTWHSLYAATACPGPYLTARMQYICDEANKINSQKEKTTATIGIVDITESGKLQRLFAADANAVATNEAGHDIRYGVGVRILLSEVQLAHMPAGYPARAGKILNEDGSISYVALELGGCTVLHTPTEPMLRRFFKAAPWAEEGPAKAKTAQKEAAEEKAEMQAPLTPTPAPEEKPPTDENAAQAAFGQKPAEEEHAAEENAAQAGDALGAQAGDASAAQAGSTIPTDAGGQGPATCFARAAAAQQAALAAGQKALAAQKAALQALEAARAGAAGPAADSPAAGTAAPAQSAAARAAAPHKAPAQKEATL